MKHAILLVDDEPAVLFGYSRYFGRAGYETSQSETLADARKALADRRYDAVLLDLNLPDGNGLDWIRDLRAENEEIAVVVITGRGDIRTAVEAMRLGADNFLVKPVDMSELEVSLQKSLELNMLRRAQQVRQRQEQKAEEPFYGADPAMAKVKESLGLVAESDAPVLLQGETGTGKGVLARSMHALSRRRGGPLLELNCSAIQGDLLASELFGHTRGAFTSAHQNKQGLIEVADGGTLFLDEIGDMDLPVQAQLLKVIEEKTYRRLGETQGRRSDFRLVCATNRVLQDEVKKGRFRSDLYFRINLFPITIPPLRERPGDIPGLARYFLDALGASVRDVPASAMRLLASYAWPGNIREFRNVIERAVLLARGGPLREEHFPGLACAEREAAPAPAAKQGLKDLEIEHIRDVIAEHGGNLKKAAAALGIARSTLYRKLSESKPAK